MSQISKLIEYSKEDIPRGSILRCKGNYPYEEVVDFLVCESFSLTDDGYRIVIASGYKAGLSLCILPNESIPDGFRFGLKADWLKRNWNRYCYDCPIEDVWIIEGIIPTLPSNVSNY